MPFLKILNTNRTYRIRNGESILDAAFENLIEINHNCGGVAACTSCIIFVKKGGEYLNHISEDEIFQLKEVKKSIPSVRLACQCKIVAREDEEIVIEIPDDIKFTESN